MNKQQALYEYLLLLGDNSMILGHRLSELCGHGPSLETDIALTNLSLDLFGQVRNYFQYAAKIQGEGKSEDDIAFLRLAPEYRNVLLVEQPNTNFAFVIGRQMLFDAFHQLLLEALQQSEDEQIAAIAHKSLKEVKYHYRFSSEWVKRLGDGTEESHLKMQQAIDYLWPYAGELVLETPLEQRMKNEHIGADLAQIKPMYWNRVKGILSEATLVTPDTSWFQSGGKNGVHTEHLGYILSDLQYMQRAYPNMTWYPTLVKQTEKNIRELLFEVSDPEIPVLSIMDMGIVRNIDVKDDQVHIKITPTYSGCPAMDTIATEIKYTLEQAGYPTQVELILSPAWTTDWITERGRQKLEDYGIAAPLEESADKQALMGKSKIVKCTNCGSTNTKLVSPFGSTACKALFQCEDCLEPFDYFKCLK